MVNDMSGANGSSSIAATNGSATTSNFTVKAGLAQMLKGGVIMDVVDAEQVRTASPLH
jgi:pyridoxal 5'-phosphate synthase pdxS subunit